MMKFKEVSGRNDICPACENETEITRGYLEETTKVRGKEIKTESLVDRCSACEEFFADTETEEENIQKIYREYRKVAGLLQPEEIKEIRERYGIGQRALSRILGWGEISVHRYEAGALQDEAHNNQMFCLKDPQYFELLFEKNKDKLAPHAATRVRQRLKELLREKKEDLFQGQLESLFGQAKDNIESGYRYFEMEKLLNAILFFTDKASVFKTKLNKLLWYFDFLCFKNTSVSATGSIYLHWALGPMPTKYDIYLDYLIQEEMIAAEEVIFDEYKDVAGEQFSALEEPDLSSFSKDETRCLEKVYEKFKNFTSKKISEFSHDEEGYKRTGNGEIISYEYAKHLKI